MIQQWLVEQTTPVFWLLDQQAFKQVIAANNGLVFDGTQILFHGETFAPVMSLSPWLIPVSDKVLALPDELLQQGIFLTTHRSSIELLSHLQSLLIAALEGEEVLFRFYDTDVIWPMLDAMRELERNDFLGPVERLAAVKQGVFQEWGNTRSAEFIYQPAPWWKIQPQHLADLYQVEQHAFSIERRLWAMCPTMMEKVVAPQSMIIEGLAAAQQHGLTAEQAEMLVLRTLQKHTLTAEDELVTVFRFTQAEYETFLHIEEKLA